MRKSRKMYCESIAMAEMFEKIHKRLRIEMAMKYSAAVVEGITTVTPAELKSPSRRPELVNARIMFTDMCIRQGLKNKDIAAYLNRTQSTISHHSSEYFIRAKFNKLFKELIEKSNIFKNQIKNKMEEKQLMKLISEAFAVAVAPLKEKIEALTATTAPEAAPEPEYSAAVQVWINDKKNPRNLQGKSLEYDPRADVIVGNGKLGGKDI